MIRYDNIGRELPQARRESLLRIHPVERHLHSAATQLFLDQFRIARIVLDPKDSNVAFVCGYAPLRMTQYISGRSKYVRAIAVAPYQSA